MFDLFAKCFTSKILPESWLSENCKKLNNFDLSCCCNWNFFVSTEFFSIKISNERSAYFQVVSIEKSSTLIFALESRLSENFENSF